MRAIVCEKLGDPEVLVLKDLPDPEPGPGEIAVDVRAAGLNFVDVLMVRGEYQYKPDLPFIPGLEAAGIVTACGEGVTGLAVGDRVMTAHRPGAFATRVTLSSDKAWAVPDDMPFEDAAVFRSAYMTAYHALVDRAKLQAGETVLVHGASGGVGMAAVHLARLMGARVIATGGSETKLAEVRKQGADGTVLATGRFRDEVKALTEGRGVDVVYDPVGGDVFDESMRCLAWGARLLIVGFTSGRPAEVKTNHLLIKGASAMGLRAGEADRQAPGLSRNNMGVLLDWVRAGKLRPHISHRFAMEDVAEGLKAVRDRKIIGRAVLNMPAG